MKKYPNILQLASVVQMAAGPGPRSEAAINGKWYPARPLGMSFLRLRAAWLVFTGKADALVWPGGQ